MIEQILSDPMVTEIIFQDHFSLTIEKNNKLTSSTWDDTEERENLINEIIQAMPKAPGYDYPISSGIWRNYRVQIINAPIVGSKPIVQLRRISNEFNSVKLQPEHWTTEAAALDIIENKFLTEKANFLIVGPTGCGKTTLLKSLLCNYCKNERIVSLEDTPELPIINEMSCNLKTYASSSDEIKDVSLNDLVKASLRLRPDRIIMGEMRGEEAASFLLMLSTGHRGSGATLHAYNSQDALYRLEMLIQMGSTWSLQTVRRLIRTSLNCIIVLDRKPDTGERRIKEISEIAGLEDDGFLVHQLYRADGEQMNF